MKSAFSLVELSIVLVILGLLTGGILAGQSLIRAAELRSVSTEYSRYITATQTFRDKYFALPGDMNNATRFWGRAENVAQCVTNSTAAVNASGTCDGDGDGTPEYNAANQHGEIWHFWRQLSLAGLIEGTYSGIAGPSAGHNAAISTNVPPSKLGQTGWMFYSRVAGGDGNFYAMDSAHNVFQIGNGTTGSTFGAALRPEEAWNIDTKMDDGRPAYGNILAIGWNNICSQADAGPGSSANTNYAASYRLTSSTVECALIFR